MEYSSAAHTAPADTQEIIRIGAEPAVKSKCRSPCTVARGGASNLFFLLLGEANHTNLYKKLIKIQMFNVNLGTIGGLGPCPPPCLRPWMRDTGPRQIDSGQFVSNCRLN